MGQLGLVIFLLLFQLFILFFLVRHKGRVFKIACIQVLLNADMHVAFTGIADCLPRREGRLKVLADLVDYPLGLEVRVKMHPLSNLQ